MSSSFPPLSKFACRSNLYQAHLDYGIACLQQEKACVTLKDEAALASYARSLDPDEVAWGCLLNVCTEGGFWAVIHDYVLVTGGHQPQLPLLFFRRRADKKHALTQLRPWMHGKEIKEICHILLGPTFSFFSLPEDGAC